MTKKLVKKLKKDKSYYYSWQANIAMAFFDEFHKVYPANELTKEIHQISNNAAKNFLDMLINVGGKNE